MEMLKTYILQFTVILRLLSHLCSNILGCFLLDYMICFYLLMYVPLLLLETFLNNDRNIKL